MDAAAARRQHADAPVAELVAHPLDDDRPGVGYGAGGGKLVAEILEQVLGGARVEIVLARQSIDRGGRRQSLQQVVHQPADREAELERAAGAIALPERHLARLARRRRHQHAVVGDLLDAPRRGAEHERLAGAALEHHLLVELADARRAGTGADEEDAEQAAIGNRAAVGDRDALGAFARGDRAGDAVPGDARPQLGELVGRIAPRQHVEHARRTRCGSAPRTAPRRESRRTARRRPSRPSTPSPRPAARRCRAGCADSGWPRPRLRASPGRPRRTPPGRRGTSGKITPSLIAFAWWPPRPIRCRPLATDGGASICTTMSIAPMSMPSSSDEVATSARSAPAFSRSSTSTRCGRAIDPWCERTSVSPASSLSAPASRSASRRLLTKISVERCARMISSSRG